MNAPHFTLAALVIMFGLTLGAYKQYRRWFNPNTYGRAVLQYQLALMLVVDLMLALALYTGWPA